MSCLVKFALLSLFVMSLLVSRTFGQGTPLPASAAVSSQKLGSVLIYNYYTARSNEETDLSLTNTHETDSIAVHLFWVNGTTNQAADMFVTLAPHQMANFLASNMSPGNAGFVVAVAVDAVTGCPRSFNHLSGDAYIKLSTGLRVSLPAEAFAAIYSGSLGSCNSNAATATLAFDGTSYNEAPRALALDSVLSLLDSNQTMVVVNRLGGSLAFGGSASPLGASEGMLYATYDVAYPYDFTFSGANSQFRSSLNNSFPVVPDGFANVIPAGITGWMKLWPTTDAGILGAALNFNANAGFGSPFYSGGQNLRYLTTTGAATLIIPVYSPMLKADLALSMTHTGNFTVGSTGSFLLDVSNAVMAKPATGTIKITDSLPSNLTLQSYSGAGWNCTGTGTANVACTNNSGLAAGASLPTLTLNVNIGTGSPTSITNTATVSVLPQQETNLTNNMANDITNSVPTINAAPLSRSAGGQSANSTIANVNDAEDAKNLLAITVNGNASATVDGVTVSGLTVDSAGVVKADVVAACNATNASFTLRVTDSGMLFAEATLDVTVNASTLGNYPNTIVLSGGNTTVTPTAPPSNSGIINSITAAAPGFTGTLSVSPTTGVVTINNASPNGNYTVTVTATDSCGVTVNTSFLLNVTCGNLIVSNNADNGAGSLRAAIANACTGGTITFANTVTSPITLASELAINKNLTILGPGASQLTISGNQMVRVFSLGKTTPSANIALFDLTIANGRADGGGIYNRATTFLTNCTVTNNTAQLGGGIFNEGTMTLRYTTISGNAATGASWFPAGGGGILNYVSGTLTLLQSTVNSNTVGSGIVNLNGNLTIESSTISNNISVTGSGGGGILNYSVSYWGGPGKATTTILNSTIAENRADCAPGFQGRGDAIAGAFITVKNSILASPSQGLGSDCYGAPTSLGHNLASDNSCALGGSGDRNNTNPLLGPLTNNGGPTQTHALLFGSPALDKGSAATGVTTDQRGLSRPVDLPTTANAIGGNGADIGAFETQTVATPAGTNITVQSAPVTLTFPTVATAGVTTVMPINPSAAGTVPGGFMLTSPPLAFEIFTTASLTPPITVCFNVPSVTNPVAFNSLSIFHNEGGNLVDRTVSRDFNSKTVCASVNSLSPFVLAQSLNNPPTISNVSASPLLLGPSTRNLVDVALSYDTTAYWGPAPCTLSVSSNEPDFGLDAEDRLNDVEIVNPNLVRLRAEQASEGTGRRYTITITCTDRLGQAANQNVLVRVNDAPILTYASAQAVLGGQTSTINPTSGPRDTNGNVTSIVVQSVTPTIGNALTVNNTTGVITISNSAPPGTYAVTIRATDNSGLTTDAPFTLSIFNTCGSVVNPATLPSASLGVPFVQTLSASPTGSYTFSLLMGALPPGLSLVNTLGIYSLRGTPTTRGQYNFTIKAKKNNSTCETIRNYTMTIL